jgi:threonine/homoserine/homoserine lactone efflux protein
MADPLQFLLTVVMLLLVPGPTNTVMATAGAGAPRSPVPLLAAELLGYATIIVLATLLLVPLAAAWPPAAIIVKLVVVAYLILVAVKLWRERIALDSRQTIIIGPRLVFFTTALNPKGLIFAVTVFPHDHPQLWAYACTFAFCVVTCGLIWFSLGRGLAALSGPRAAILPRVASIALIGFAALIVSSVGR